MTPRAQHKPRRAGRPPGACNAWRKVSGHACTVEDIAKRLGVSGITARKYYATAAAASDRVTWRALEKIRDAVPVRHLRGAPPSKRARDAAALRGRGHSWAEVGSLLGVSRQRAQQLGARGADHAEQ